MNAYDLDWGAITPDLFDNEKSVAVHSINFSWENEENFARSKSFLIGRAQWYAKHLPNGSSQKAIIDVRGQNLIPEIAWQLKNNLAGTFVNSKLLDNLSIEIYE